LENEILATKSYMPVQLTILQEYNITRIDLTPGPH
jgi:hypothetical protein